MKRNKLLIFLMAFILLIQPVAAMAAESGTDPTAQEQAVSAERPADEKETDGMADEASGAETATESSENLTDEPPQDAIPSGEQSEEESPLEDGKDPQEGTAEQETEETETEGTETGKTETEETDTDKTETEGTETEEIETEGTETGKTEIEETEETETEEIETEETETGETAAAAENETAEAEPEESRIVLELPVPENYDSSPFDFIMDPQGLITETNAAKYGGAGFEEGATLYFKNTDGDYEYSHISDWLGIISRSNIPVCVTVELAVEDTYGVNMVQDTSFSADRSRSMYLALLDSDGNETAVGADGKAVFRTVLPACGDEDETAVCSFALTGCCNPAGDWSGMAECPRITVNWTAKPLISGEGTADEL